MTTTALVFLVVGLLLVVASQIGAWRTITHERGDFFAAWCVVGVIGAVSLIIGFENIDRHQSEQRAAEAQTQARLHHQQQQALLEQAVTRQRQLYDQLGSYSDSERDAIPQALAAALKQHELVLDLDESELDGSVRLRLTEADGDLLGQRLLRLPSAVAPER